MIYFLRLLLSDERLVQFYIGRDRPDLAWRVLTFQQSQELRGDPLSTYQLKAAKRDLQRSELAQNAAAFEWAWVNAADCLAVIAWREQTGRRQDADAPIQAKAQRLKREAEEHIDPERVSDLEERHRQTVKSHNSVEEYDFKRFTLRSKARLWRRALKGVKTPSLSDRPY